jgi:anti-sigma factor RsiW
MHLDDERLQRLIDGELAPEAARDARDHVAGCEACRARLAAAERETGEVRVLFTTLDRPGPPVAVRDVIARAARTSARAPAPLARAAAGILVAAALAGVAYAVPGSPVRDWVAAVVEWAGGRSPATVAPAPQGTPGPDSAGISVPPGAALVIEFRSWQTAGFASVELTGEPEVSVRAPAGGATFRSESNRLVIDNRSPSDSFAIRIPRGAPDVAIRIAGETVFVLARGNVTTSAPREGAAYRVPLSKG